MLLKDLYPIYTANIKDQDRTIGVEAEYPVVRIGNFNSALNADVDRLFGRFTAAGWDAKKDDQTGKITSVSKSDDGAANITTDFGSGTLEINHHPRKRLTDIERDYFDQSGYLKDYLEAEGLVLLGYGISPITKPGRALVAQKGRYRTLEQRFWTRHQSSFVEPESTDVHYHTINASSQVHVSVRSAEEAIEAINGFNAASPIIIGLMANSSVWLNRIDPMYKDPRQLFWDWVVNIPQDRQRKGVPQRRFKDMQDYLDQQLSFEPIMTARILDGKVVYYEVAGAESLRSAIETGGIPVVEPGVVDRKVYDTQRRVVLKGGSRVGYLQPNPIDLFAQDSFTWYEARFKAEYGTVELRCCAQQPLKDRITVSALALGLMENLNGLKNLVGDVDLDEVRRSRHDAIRNGLNARYNGMSISSYAKALVDLAREGLKRRQLGEEVYLDSLYRRVSDNLVPADQAMELFKSHGVEGIIEWSRMRKE